MPDTPSPKHGIVRPADGDFVNSWPAQTREIVDWIDPNIATFTEEDPRPAAGVSGRWHRSPTTGALSFDTGLAWLDVPWGSIAATLAPGGDDPLTVTYAMLAADVPLVNIGDQVPTARKVLPANGKFAWCDGSLIRADLYPNFVAALGSTAAEQHAYNGGVSPGNDAQGNPLIRLPNKNGRTSIGAGTATGATGATAKLRGARAGAETAALPNHVHSHAHTHVAPSHSHVQQGGLVVNGGSSYAVAELVGTGNAGGTATAGASVTNTDNPTTLPATSLLSPYEVDNWMVRIA